MGDDHEKYIVTPLPANGSQEDVRTWLRANRFSAKAIEKLGDMDAAGLFNMSRQQFRDANMLGPVEGKFVYTRVTLAKNYSWFDTYFNFLVRHPKKVLLFWFGIFVLGVLYGLKFLGETKTTFDAPPGTLAHEAEQIFGKAFSDKPSTMVVYIKHEKGLIAENNFTYEFSHRLKREILDLDEEKYGRNLDILSYYTVQGTPYELMSEGFLSADKDATIISISYEKIDGPKEAALIDWVKDTNKVRKREVCELLELDPRHFDVGTTGQSVLFYEVITGTIADMIRTDSIVIPIALLVLGTVVRSLPLILIPILSVLVSIMLSFTIMTPIAMHLLAVASFAPNLMSSLVIAMSIDYSLFLLSRYREEVEKKRAKFVAVRTMTQQAGEIIVVSGSTLAVTFLGLVFFPLDFLRSIGVGCSVTLLGTLVINLSLTPAILLTIDFESCCGLTARCRRIFSRSNSAEASGYHLQEDKQSKQGYGFWMQSARLSTTKPIAVAIIVLVFVLAVPVAVQLSSMRVTIDSNQIFPKDSEALGVFNKLALAFNPGQISPFYVMMTAPSNNTVTSQEFFETMYNVGRHLKQSPEGKDCVFTSISEIDLKLAGFDPIQFALPYDEYVNLTAINSSWPAIQAGARLCLDPTYDIVPGDDNTTFFNQTFCFLYRALWNAQVDSSNKTALLQVQTPFDPLGDESPKWIKKIRVVMNKIELPPGYKIYLTAGATAEADAVDRIYELFPTEIAITGALVFVIVGVIFKSLFLPARLLVTIAVPITFVFGMGVIVFENSRLMGEPVSALYWLTPVMSFSILVGLGLDYDVFLLSRIFEYRKEGYNDRASILKGVHKTGGIITAAGLIMTIAFSALLFSSQKVLNEFGFMMCVAILMDTFIVRTLMVPAIMVLARWVNWWPGTVPNPTITEDNMDSDVDEDEPNPLFDDSAGAKYHVQDTSDFN